MTDRSRRLDGNCQPLDDRADRDGLHADVRGWSWTFRALHRGKWRNPGRGHGWHSFHCGVPALMPATLGNIFGGILMVSLLNYGQVKNL